MVYFPKLFFIFLTCFYKNIDRNPLHNIKNILINASIRRSFIYP